MDYRYLLFDLDGTLLPMDTERFIGAYIKTIAEYMQKYLSAQEFVGYLLAATETMIKDNDPGRTNEQVFIADFFRRSGLEPKDILPVFENFYKEKFPALKSYTAPSLLSRLILDQALEADLRVVIATNPVFPCMAIKERLRWAGVSEYPFELITAYENMHFCKPNCEYYSEILDLLGAMPEQCLMIGNDVEEDMIAARLGIHTYLVEDYLINRSREPLKVDYRGSLKELFTFLKKIA